MILRQTIIRHGKLLLIQSGLEKLIFRAGRSAFPRSAQRIVSRSYATDIDLNNPIHRHERDIRTIISQPGHPDESSSLLEASGITPTTRTEEINERIDAVTRHADNILSQINSLFAARNAGSVPTGNNAGFVPLPLPPSPFDSMQEFYAARKEEKTQHASGSSKPDLKWVASPLL